MFTASQAFVVSARQPPEFPLPTLRSKTAALHQLQDAHAEESKIDELANQLDWDIRVYEDEKKTVSYVCEVPQLIERRLFALSRMIQQALE